jgi:hypothetical protein
MGEACCWTPGTNQGTMAQIELSKNVQDGCPVRETARGTGRMDASQWNFTERSFLIRKRGESVASKFSMPVPEKKRRRALPPVENWVKSTLLLAHNSIQD